MVVSKSVIELRNVTKIYKLGRVEVPALKKINLKIKRAEFIAIMGKSGSGKSTALNLIGCLDLPTYGEIFLDGINIAKLSENELARIRGKKIGFVFQRFNLIQTLTALENVMLPMMFQGVSEKEKRAVELLKIVGLEKRADHKPAELSGGEVQRIAIARALANEPEIILADEPTGNLDSKTGKDILQILKKINKEKNTTLIIVTHDEAIARTAEKIIHLKDGEIANES